MNRNYPAFILRDDGAYSVGFPDLPGCLTWGSSVNDAFDNAREALEGHLAALHDAHMPIPEPSALSEVTPEDEDTDAVEARVLVPATLPGKTVRTNITIDESLLTAIDAISSNRSAFLTEAARNELSRRRDARLG